MSNTTSRIAKNTLALYFRQILTMLAGLYTLRVVLAALGAEDYGIYNVVAGVLVLFGFMNGALSAAISRFITRELGTGDEFRLKKTFEAARTINLAVSALIVLFGETAGWWFFSHKMVIPCGRIHTAAVIYQTSLVIIVLQFTQMPYTAVIMAHEHMDIFAKIEVLNTALKLLAAYLLPLIPHDKLLVYGLTLMCVNIISGVCYRIYSFIKFPESRSFLCVKSEFIAPMLAYSSLDMYGNLSVMARTQGINVLLNIFFGPVLNAANGFAGSVQGAVGGFSGNILQAFRPQIIISYVRGDKALMSKYIRYAARYGFLLSYIICLPLFLEMPLLLRLWLKNVPEYTVGMCRASLFFTVLASNFSGTLVTGLHAAGKIRAPNLINGTLYLSVVPITWICFKNGVSPVFPFILNTIFVFIGGVSNLIVLKHHVKEFSIKAYILQAAAPCFAVFVISSIPAFAVHRIMNAGMFRVLLVTLCCFLTSAIGTWFIGMEKETKALVKNKIASFVRKRIDVKTR